MKEKFNEKVIPVILKFINTKAIQSIKKHIMIYLEQWRYMRQSQHR